jgi:hypothetical protein
MMPWCRESTSAHQKPAVLRKLAQERETATASAADMAASVNAAAVPLVELPTTAQGVESRKTELFQTRSIAKQGALMAKCFVVQLACPKQHP